MRSAAGVLDLSPGAELVLDGVEWTVERREPHLRRVHLVAADGARQRVSFRFLASHAVCRASSRTAAVGADRGRQPKTVRDLERGKRELAELRMAHLGLPLLTDCYRGRHVPAVSRFVERVSRHRRLGVTRGQLRVPGRHRRLSGDEADSAQQLAHFFAGWIGPGRIRLVTDRRTRGQQLMRALGRGQGEGGGACPRPDHRNGPPHRGPRGFPGRWPAGTPAVRPR
jgi:hypothetical protein